MRELDDTILSILEQEDAEKELETVLSCYDVKIERCMNKVAKESIELSRVMSSSSPSLLSRNPEVKVKLLKLEIPKFDGDITRQTFQSRFNVALRLI